MRDTTTATAAALRAHAATIAAELADTLAMPPDVDYGDDVRPDSPRWRDQSLSKGAAGIAVLHGLRVQHGLGGTEAMQAWLARATRDGLTAGPGAGLWFGAPAVGFALHLAAPGRYQGALARLDAAVAQLVRTRLTAAAQRMDAARRPSQYEFDLTRGLVGLGAYLLRRDPGGALLRRVLDYLVSLTRPIPADDAAGSRAPGWWTADLPAGMRDSSFDHGHANLGMAHGITAAQALLALAMREGITVDGHADAIETISLHLDVWRQPSAAGPWWPERITLDELEDGRPHRDGPARPSWCYGTPGIARAQQLAALALDDTARQHTAEDALTRCLADPAQLARVTDPALCHGWAGIVATAWHAAADATTPGTVHGLDRLLVRLLDHAHDTAPDQAIGLIEGSAGIALTLHSIATDTAGGWPTCLLIN
ncbi:MULTISPECIES: lanthionine synthetase C family protein [unclassified Streptomyces]|uniref:lanthionine synthetase C family protein n=1 Tax=unclassified Streptomyces TaxID=2593676 RepID=UPI000A70781F|nr:MULTISPECIES: lanthionine synthetase C family protein [unclassified Streptomyces]WSA38951.1 lanthionine synthetase C family protein [Streptomyces sp. NBC_01808]